jgi:multidrug efflux system membrane fusion protein
VNRSIIIAVIIAIAVTAWIASGQMDKFSGSTGNDAEASTKTDGVNALTSTEDDAPEKKKKLTGVRVQTFTAKPREQEVIVHGKTEAFRVVELKAEISGRVKKVHVDDGDRVKAGDPIVSFDVKDNKAKLLEAEALVRQREIEHKAAKSLNKKGFSSTTTLASAKAQLDSANAKATGMRIHLEDLVVTAPFDGYIEHRTAEVGDFFKDGDEITTIVDSNPLLVTGQISELQVNSIEVGGKGTARLVTGEEISGEITFVSNMADAATRTFRIELEVPNANNKLRNGVTAEISIKTKSVDAHFISPALLTLDDTGLLGLRAVGANDIVEFYPIKILSDTPQGVWVAGLPETINLITVGQDFVREGDQVKPDFDTAEASQ